MGPTLFTGASGQVDKGRILCRPFSEVNRSSQRLYRLAFPQVRRDTQERRQKESSQVASRAASIAPQHCSTDCSPHERKPILSLPLCTDRVDEEAVMAVADEWVARRIPRAPPEYVAKVMCRRSRTRTCRATSRFLITFVTELKMKPRRKHERKGS